MPDYEVKKYDIKSRRVLLVEDEAAERETIAEALEEMGFEKIEMAASGAAALSKLKKDPHGYPIIILDIFLTDMTAKHLAGEFPQAHSVETLLIFSGGRETDFAAVRIAFEALGIEQIHSLKKPASPEMLEKMLT